MKNKMILVCLLSFFLSAGVSFAKDKGSKQIIINGGKKGNITLTHQLHQERLGDCMICHKSFSQKKGALSEAIESGKLKKKLLMNKTCLKCHRERKKTGKPFGPIKCSGCHIK